MSRYEEMRKLLEEQGYKSQAELDRALIKTKHYKDRNADSTRVYINQVFAGKTTLSDNLERALLKLCNNDGRIINRLKKFMIQIEISNLY